MNGLAAVVVTLSVLTFCIASTLAVWRRAKEKRPPR